LFFSHGLVSFVVWLRLLVCFIKTIIVQLLQPVKEKIASFEKKRNRKAPQGNRRKKV
jgi:heme exporter protein D